MTIEYLTGRALKLAEHFSQETNTQSKRTLYAQTLNQRNQLHNDYRRWNQQMSKSISCAKDSHNYANLLWNFACFVFETTEALTICHEEWLNCPNNENKPTYLAEAINANALCIKLMTQSQQLYQKQKDKDSAQKCIDQYIEHQSYLTTLPIIPYSAIQQDEEDTLIETLMSLANTSESPASNEYSYLHQLQTAQQHCLNIQNELNKAITNPDHFPLPLQEELFASLEHLSKQTAESKKRKADTDYEPLFFKRNKSEHSEAIIYPAIRSSR